MFFKGLILFLIITVSIMNLQSPTTLLTSIQLMKNKLRNDKQTLIQIKNEFSQFNKKQAVPCEQDATFVLADISNIQNKYNKNSFTENVSKAKVLELRREHQRQISRLKQQHQREVSQLLRVKQMQMQDLDNMWRQKLQEQVQYIALLEDQACSPIQTQRDPVPKQQYDAIIKQLSQENTRLYDENCQYQQQCQKWRKLYNDLDSQRTNKSRLKFVKRKDQCKVSQYKSQKSQVAHKRVSSLYFLNDQNVDTSNIQSDRDLQKEWEDIGIDDEQGGLKTIRQFSQSILDDKNFKRKGDEYLSVRI